MRSILIITLFAASSFLFQKWRKTAPTAKEEDIDFVQRIESSRSYRTLAILGAALSLVLALQQVYTLLGWPTVWPSAPTIEARNTVNASAEILPFKISVGNSLLPITELHLSCATLMYFGIDDVNHTMIFNGPLVHTELGEATAAVQNFACDGTAISLRDDGRVMLAGNPDVIIPAAYMAPPLKPIKVCVEVVAMYKILGLKRKTNPTIFQWPALPRQRQWIDSETDTEDENGWIPEGSTLVHAFGLRRGSIPVGDGNFIVDPRALKCSLKSSFWIGDGNRLYQHPQ